PLSSFPTRRSSDLWVKSMVSSARWISPSGSGGSIKSPTLSQGSANLSGASSSSSATTSASATAMGTLRSAVRRAGQAGVGRWACRSEEHTSELQSRENLVCRLLLEKKKKILYKVLIKTGIYRIDEGDSQLYY